MPWLKHHRVLRESTTILHCLKEKGQQLCSAAQTPNPVVGNSFPRAVGTGSPQPKPFCDLSFWSKRKAEEQQTLLLEQSHSMLPRSIFQLAITHKPSWHSPKEKGLPGTMQRPSPSWAGGPQDLFQQRITSRHTKRAGSNATSKPTSSGSQRQTAQGNHPKRSQHYQVHRSGRLWH